MTGTRTADRDGRGEMPPGPRRPLPRSGGRGLSRRGVLVVLMAVTVVAAAVCWLLYGSQWLRVERVTVTGDRVLTPGEIREAAAVPVGDPVASVDTGAIERRLTAALPRIAVVEVRRSWPHAVRLEVTERTPQVLLEESGKFVEVDGEGVRFATVRTAPRGVPVAELETSSSPSLRYFGTKRLLRAAVEVTSGLPDPVRLRTRVVRVRSYDDITLELSDGRTVMWGSPELNEEKAVALLAVMKAVKSANRYDVSAPSAPAAAGS